VSFSRGKWEKKEKKVKTKLFKELLNIYFVKNWILFLPETKNKSFQSKRKYSGERNS